MRHRLLLLAGLAAILVALHVPLLRMPLHWDEMGQFVPAALDLWRDGAWVPHSTLPNIHPPGLMALLAAVWSLTGYSILVTRLTMLGIASVGAYLAFLLAIRLSRGAVGAPAFAAVAYLLAAPIFYTQSMMVLLDLPAMVLTAAALLLFLDQRSAACAAVCVALVLVKETALTTPAVFAAWLWLREGRRREALYFAAPAVALAGWLLALKTATGSWFGNAEFARYNVTESVAPLHVLYAILRRIYFLFFADGHWIGSLCLYWGWRALRGRQWTIALSVAGAQVMVVTLLGGAVLDRYLLPALPVLYAAFATSASLLPAGRRLAAQLALLGLLVAGWWWNSPFPLPLENNLAVADFVHLQREAAQYVESVLRGRRVVSVWPFLSAVRNPDFGYVQSAIPTLQAPGLRRADLASLELRPEDLIVLYSRGVTPRPWLTENPWIRPWLERFLDPAPEASAAEMRALGFLSQARWERRGQWIEVYARESVPGHSPPLTPGPGAGNI
jgi:hypothetical protein